ncbi:MAG: hypothetical protein M0Z36_02460 [Thermaerobacter sp.]|nr:hypothetical protein [Thermaerobacter sp.]
MAILTGAAIGFAVVMAGGGSVRGALAMAIVWAIASGIRSSEPSE